MLFPANKSDLLVELSTQEQQMLSGGQEKGRLNAQGNFIYNGQTYPAEVRVRIYGLP